MAKILIVLLSIGIGTAVLHRFGLLKPSMEQAKASVGQARRLWTSDVPGREAERQNRRGEREPEQAVPPPLPAEALEASHDATDVQDAALTKALRDRYRPPPIGAAFTVQLNNGQVLEGVLAAVSPTDITLQKGEAVIQLPREQASPLTQAVCYEDAFIDYMLARYREAEASRAESIDPASRSSVAPSSHSPPAPDPAAASLRQPTGAEKATDARRVASGQMSFKEWMDKYNQNNQLLLARQQRMKEHEAQARREGLAY